MNKFWLCVALLICLGWGERDPFATELSQAQPTEILSIKTYALTYKKPETLANTLTPLYLGAVIQGDTEVKALIIRATTAQHASIKKQLQILDQPLPQISIEVQAIELNNNALQDLGIRWYLQDKINVSDLDETSRILERLRLLIGQGKGSLKAAPKITTSLGIPAVIHIGDKVPYAIPVERGQTTSYEINYLDAGVILNILPESISTSSIVLNVQPKVNSIKQWKQTVGGEYPILSSREVSTTVRIRNNESFIIGGLLNQEDRHSVQKIPFLGDIPFIGFLFQHTTQETLTSDTIFVVTAKKV